MAERRGHPGWAAFLFVVVLLGCVVLGVWSRLAFDPINGPLLGSVGWETPEPDPVLGTVLAAATAFVFLGGLWGTWRLGAWRSAGFVVFVTILAALGTGLVMWLVGWSTLWAVPVLVGGLWLAQRVGSGRWVWWQRSSVGEEERGGQG